MEPFSKIKIVLTFVTVTGIAYLIFFNTKKNPIVIPSSPALVVEDKTWLSVETKKETMSESNHYYTIDASYPITKDTRISDHFKTYIDEQIAQFKDDTSWVNDTPIDSNAPPSLSLDINYREEKSTRVDTYIFSIVTYTGGAHGLQVTRTFSFDQNGKALSIGDLFINGEDGLTTISVFVQKELTKKAISDANWIADGAGPKAENYQNFIINDTGVTFVFDPYQVAAYAAGTQNISVPLNVFKTIANPALFGI